jgi:hypothetical protein
MTPSSPNYKEKDDDYSYFDTPGSSPALPLHNGPLNPLNTTTRRSRTRLLLLSLLGVCAIIGIATWQAPDHIKSKAAEVVQSLQETAHKEWQAMDGKEWQDMWQSAKQWSGLSAEEKEEVMREAELEDAEDSGLLVSDEDQTPTEAEVELKDVAKDDADQVEDIKEEHIPSKELDASEDEKTVTDVTPEDTSSYEEPAEEEEPVVTAALPEFHPLYVLPNPARKPSGDPNEKFLAYLPHSGYHNQRIELANSMMLALHMNRTLLVPPVWVGWPMTTQPFRELVG